MSTKDSSTPSLSDFAAAVDKLEPTGSNWVMWQNRFMIAVRQKRVWSHFDGTSSKPVPMIPGVPSSSTDKAIEDWQDKEDLARHLLVQKLPDSLFSKHMRKTTVAEIWSAIVTEFTHKSMLMKANLHSEFMAMRCTKGANLREEFNRVRMKYEQLRNADIPVSDDDYRTLVINFVPGELSSFLAQISANQKMLVQQILSRLPVPTPPTSGDTTTPDFSEIGLDAESLMETACEEWERRDTYRRNHPKSAGSSSAQSQTADVALATVSSEKPGSRSGGGRRKFYRGPRRPVGVCWNCGGSGHKQDACTSAKKEPGTAGQSQGDPKKPSSSNPKPKGGSANAVTEPVIKGSWAAFVADFDEFATFEDAESGFEVLDALTEVDDEEELTDISDLDLGELVYPDGYGHVTFDYGFCSEERLPFRLPKEDEAHGPSAEGLQIFEGPTIADVTVSNSAMAFATVVEYEAPSLFWDMYDSGASHHMSPNRHDFVNFKALAPRPLTAANQQSFMAEGIGEMIITLPNDSTLTRIRLRGVLYTPSLGFRTVIGR